MLEPQCIKCQYYYITWDKSFPYGCKAMGIKSFKTPALVVFESSGKPCLAFNDKQLGKNHSIVKK